LFILVFIFSMRFSEWLKWNNFVEASASLAPVAQSMFVPPRKFDERKRARKFLKWLSGLGVDVKKYIDHIEEGSPVEIPIPFSGGAVGAAFPMDRYIVKITTDATEAKYASRLIGHSDPGVAKIYDVVAIPGDVELNKAKRKLYAIVQEKLSVNAPKKLRVAGDVVYTYLDKFAQPLEDVDAAYNYIVNNILPEKGKKWASDPDVLRLVRQLLRQVKDLQDKYNFTYRDIHGGNLLMKGRKPAFFDLGRSTPMPGAKFPNPKELG
jgi:hypothetical protein